MTMRFGLLFRCICDINIFVIMIDGVRRGRRGVVVVLFMLCGICLVQRAHALPEQGALRWSLHGGVINAYFADSSRLTTIADAFPIALDELEQYGTTSATNFFALGAATELQYGLHELVALGFRGGAEYSFSGLFSRPDVRIPLLLTASFRLLDWLEIQPAIGMNISYNARTQLVAPNVDVALRLRIFDRFDLSSGLLYGAIGGFYFAFSVRLFDFFALPINGEIADTIEGSVS